MFLLCFVLETGVRVQWGAMLGLLIISIVGLTESGGLLPVFYLGYGFQGQGCTCGRKAGVGLFGVEIRVGLHCQININILALGKSEQMLDGFTLLK